MLSTINNITHTALYYNYYYTQNATSVEAALQLPYSILGYNAQPYQSLHIISPKCFLILSWSSNNDQTDNII